MQYLPLATTVLGSSLIIAALMHRASRPRPQRARHSETFEALLAVEQEYVDAEGENLSADTIDLVYKALTGVTKYDAVD